jgi:hypothetical protein
VSFSGSWKSVKQRNCKRFAQQTLFVQIMMTLLDQFPTGKTEVIVLCAGPHRVNFGQTGAVHHVRSASHTSSITGSHWPSSRCRNRRIDGYHGLSVRSLNHRHCV